MIYIPNCCILSSSKLLLLIDLVFLLFDLVVSFLWEEDDDFTELSSFDNWSVFLLRRFIDKGGRLSAFFAFLYEIIVFIILPVNLIMPITRLQIGITIKF